MVREKILEEGIRLEREEEIERVKQKGKVPAAQVDDSGLTSVVDPREEIAMLKNQVKCLQGKIREDGNTKVEKLNHYKRAEKGDNPDRGRRGTLV